MTKPGYLTSEFWLTATTLLLTNLGTLEVPERFRWLLTLGVVVGYSLSRAIAKVGGPLIEGPELPVHPASAAVTAAQKKDLKADAKRAGKDTAA
jgi:hypothetical protein